MTPERWQQVKEIFNSAINVAPAERQAFLSRICSDDEDLRNEVEALIRSHEKSGEFIDGSAFTHAGELFTEDEWELSPGATIASYEVISFISRGGMGEVYLAEDRRLSRKVALKLLPASFTRDLERLRRFEQEARSASALNHPNIITIYEILETGSTHLIATEFVEGETLRARLAHSQFSLNEALQIAIQIADALSAAHKAGIVHRDIKPENIMLRPDGYIKVLDFGLAKLAHASPNVVSAEAPTVQVRTGSGVVIGTAGYMSPEQARALTVDARSDIFSLGAVIYEMVASRKPFDGATASDVLAAILTSEPPPLAQLIAGLPAELVRIVNKSLRKDREERYQVVKELLLDLRALKQELDFHAKLEQSRVSHADSLPGTGGETNASPAGASRTAASQSPTSSLTQSVSGEIRRHKSWVVAILAGVFLLLAASSYGFYKLLTGKSSSSRFQTMTITRLTNSGKAIDVAISPDGNYIVYVLSDRGEQSLWIRQVSTANDKQILSPSVVGFFGIAFSPDGSDLYYCVKEMLDAGTLYRVPVLGGTPVKLLERIDSAVSFSPDGKLMALVRSNFPQVGESALVIVNSDGGNERTLAIRKPPQRFSPIFFAAPSWSPNGETIAATVGTTGSMSQVKFIRVADGSEERIPSSQWLFCGRVHWLPDMSGVLFIAGDHPGVSQILLQSYPDGAVHRVTNDLNGYRSISLTTDGARLAAIQASGLINIWVAPGGDAQRAVQLPTGNLGFFASGGSNLSWTPDGRIVFVSTESGAQDIWLMDSDGGNRKQLTSNAGQNFTPVSSPDGRYVVYVSMRAGARNLWRINPDGSNPKQLTAGANDVLPTVSPDGKWVVYSSLDFVQTLWKVGIDGGKPVQLTKQVAIGPAVSPDGRYISYFYPDSPDPQAPPNRIAVIPFDGGEPIQRFSFEIGGTINPFGQWSADGSSILYLLSSNNVTNIWSQPLAGGSPKQITDFKDSLMTGFSWSRDGKQLACARGLLMRDAVLIKEGGADQ
jgi:serine/threonine protein kinase